MKRLEKNLESTVPFVNSDFNNILQDQHRIAYSAYLDGINDIKYSTFSTNRGIILSGIEIEAELHLATNLTFDYTLTINRNKSLVYFDGQYYTPSDNLVDPQSTDDEITLSYPRCVGLALYPITQSIQPPTDTDTIYRSSSRDFKNGVSQPMTIDYRFEIQVIPTPQVDPTFFVTTITKDGLSNQSLVNLGLTYGQPYILISNGGTSRNLSRLIKLNTCVKDDIKILYDLKKWSATTGVQGGFVYRDFNFTYGPGVPFYDFIQGVNELKGFSGLTAIAGRMPVGYDKNGLVNPTNTTSLQLNYGTPSNTGGSSSVALEPKHFPKHNHGGFTSKTTSNLDHGHGILMGKSTENVNIPNGSVKGLGRAVNPQGTTSPADSDLGFPPRQTDFTDEKFLTRSLPYWTQGFDEFYGLPNTIVAKSGVSNLAISSTQYSVNHNVADNGYEEPFSTGTGPVRTANRFIGKINFGNTGYQSSFPGTVVHSGGNYVHPANPPWGTLKIKFKIRLVLELNTGNNISWRFFTGSAGQNFWCDQVNSTSSPTRKNRYSSISGESSANPSNWIDDIKVFVKRQLNPNGQQSTFWNDNPTWYNLLGRTHTDGTYWTPIMVKAANNSLIDFYSLRSFMGGTNDGAGIYRMRGEDRSFFGGPNNYKRHLVTFEFETEFVQLGPGEQVKFFISRASDGHKEGSEVNIVEAPLTRSFDIELKLRQSETFPGDGWIFDGVGSLPQNIFSTTIEVITENPTIPTAENELSINHTNHRHQIDTVGSSTPHENRPPYCVVLYYYKI